MFELITYRGHIRNWKDLCNELDIDPLMAREERENSILLKGFSCWGENLPNHLNGMFAFAIKDKRDNSIFCSRDPFGLKPFYYTLTDNNDFIFGTMIRDILSDSKYNKELNEDMLQLYLSFTYIPGENTFFKGIKKLMPGTNLVFQDNAIILSRYFYPKFNIDNTKTPEEWADKIATTMEEICSEMDDEYTESFLSGGVDSSYLLAVSNAKRANSCGYEEERFDESILAQNTADSLNKKLNRCIITPEEYFKIVPWVMYNMEQPLGDASAIAFALGCQSTAKHTPICYSGEGPDEFFGGYNIYRNAERYGDNLKNFYVGNTNIMKEDEKKLILKNYNQDNLPINIVKYIYENNDYLDPLSKMLDVDIQIWLEGDIYLNVDKMSTAAGLEVRMPFSDKRIFNIASKIPASMKITEEQNKYPFRLAASRILPKDVAFRKKLGFVVPIRIWLADSRYNKDVVEKFNSENASKFFDLKEINKIFNDYINGNSDNWRKVWVIYTFLVWYEQYFNI